MSETQQTPNKSRNLVILVVAAVLLGVVWYAVQSGSKDKTAEKNTQKPQTNQTANKETTDQYKGWKSYTWASQGVSFKYPETWTTQENTAMGRLYAKNSTVNLLEQEAPDDFQQIWLSHDEDEASKAREDSIKKGESSYRQVNSAVKANTIKAGSLTINTYEYDTVGGPTLEAYWTNKAGTRLLATTSTEIGQQNQKDMVANLKKLLASVELK